MLNEYEKVTVFEQTESDKLSSCHTTEVVESTLCAQHSMCDYVLSLHQHAQSSSELDSYSGDYF